MFNNLVIVFSSQLSIYSLLTLLIATENSNVARVHPQAQSQIDTLNGLICQMSIKVLKMMRMRMTWRTKDVHKTNHHSRNAKTFCHVNSQSQHVCQTSMRPQCHSPIAMQQSCCPHSPSTHHFQSSPTQLSCHGDEISCQAQGSSHHCHDQGSSH